MTDLHHQQAGLRGLRPVCPSELRGCAARGGARAGGCRGGTRAHAGGLQAEWCAGRSGGSEVMASTESWYAWRLKSELSFFFLTVYLSLCALGLRSKPIRRFPPSTRQSNGGDPRNLVRAVRREPHGPRRRRRRRRRDHRRQTDEEVQEVEAGQEEDGLQAHADAVEAPPTGERRRRRRGTSPCPYARALVRERVVDAFERSAIASTAPRAVPPRPGDTLTIARARDVVGGARDRVGRSVRGPSTPPRREFERSAIASLRARSLTPNPPRRSSRP